MSRLRNWICRKNNMEPHEHFHVHLDLGELMNPVLDKLTNLEETLSLLTEAVDSLVVRVTEDFDHLKAEAARLQALVDAAAALDVTQVAEIDALKAEAAGVMDRINSIDPVADFPPLPDPEPEPEPEPDPEG